MLSGRYRIVVLAFEGPDRYASVGGLGVRVTELSHALSAAGYPTTLLFVGDPDAPAVERIGEHLELRRWAQWLSRRYPASVYDGEAAKIADFGRSVPPFLIDEIIAPASANDQHVLVLAEDWQTADTLIDLDRGLRGRGLRHAATLLWNANNTYGFERIDLRALAKAATVTAVSRYMKFELAASGVGSLVVPNGIPSRLLDGAAPRDVETLRQALGAGPWFAKIGRYSPDKAWMQAIDALAHLREMNHAARLIVRGGKENYGEEVFARAEAHGLRTLQVTPSGRDLASIASAIAEASDQADIIDLRVYLEDPILAALYVSVEAVLANSRKEPFGLVGLEVMAAGGIPVCGSTGEEYAEPFVNAIVVDTDDSRELASALAALVEDPGLAPALRAAGPATAQRYTWPSVIATLIRKLPFIEAWQHAL